MTTTTHQHTDQMGAFTMTTTTHTPRAYAIGTAQRLNQTEAMLAFTHGATIMVSKDDSLDTRPVTSGMVRHTNQTVAWDELDAMAGDGPISWWLVRLDRDGTLEGKCRCWHATSEHGPDGCEHTATGPNVSAGCACTARMPAACDQRAASVSARWESFASESSKTYAAAASLESIAHRIAWDAPAAGEYPRPMLTSAAALAWRRPEMTAQVWHHAAGATILGDYCCGTPASHRDALVQMARELIAGQR